MANDVLAPSYSGGYYGDQIDSSGGTSPDSIDASNYIGESNSTINTPAQTSSKYDFVNYTYPEDLFDSSGKYGNTYVAFYINVQEDSKLARENPEMIIADSDSEKGIGSAITRNKVTGAQLGGALAGIGVVGGTVIGKTLGIGSGSGAVAGATVGGLAAAGQVVGKSGMYSESQATPNFNIDNLLFKNITKQTKRLKAAIALYTPNELSFKYSVSYDTENTSVLSAGLNVGEDLGNAISNFNTSQSSGYAGSKNAIAGLVLAASQAAAPGGLSALTGTVANPKKEQMFNNVDFRSHQFTFRFWIRNQLESIAVANIIKQFKYHMHPEFKDGNDFIFLYPSEFDIKFFTEGEESAEFPKMTTCVLTDMNTNYTPSGAMNLLRDGKIPEISVNLAFRELSILTKAEIEEGF